MTLLLRVVRVGAVVFAAAFLGVGMYFALAEPSDSNRTPRAVLTGSKDLLLRHNEVRMILMGENIYQLALDDTLEQRAEELLGPGHLLDPDYFPSTLLPVLLLAKFPFLVVRVVWLLVSLGSTILLIQTMRWMMGRTLPAAADQALMVCLWVCGIPFWSCLAMGQASLFSLAFVLAAFRADSSGRPLLAGLLLALGVFKYALIWPLVLFLFILQWRWRCLLVGGGIHLVVHLVLCRIIHANPITIFADVLHGNGKVFHFSRMLTVWLPFRSWNRTFPDFMLPSQLLGALLLLALLVGLGWLWLRRSKEDRTHLLIWLAVLELLAVLAISTRIFAHMYTLPVLLLACAPVSFAFTPFQRGRLITYVLYLAYVPGGVDDAGLSAPMMHLLHQSFNVVLAMLVVEMGLLLFRLERGTGQTESHSR
ncbi:glycosyltransferase 87 family protein [Prosthecobacter sp.]|uniref:glycosyltransferase 87 family protein n=1 Tax=Prosthecobacter sp. TaxID=1965333 RepID=UPI001D37C280|nr:glycosyltransferase 87 family protein [Prosthecobacter sp.]MCB1278759.1 DUF2029 domain-containing protein [Prosthecobacter sp.]